MVLSWADRPGCIITAASTSSRRMGKLSVSFKVWAGGGMRRGRSISLDLLRLDSEQYCVHRLKTSFSSVRYFPDLSWTMDTRPCCVVSGLSPLICFPIVASLKVFLCLLTLFFSLFLLHLLWTLLYFVADCLVLFCSFWLGAVGHGSHWLFRSLQRQTVSSFASRMNKTPSFPLAMAWKASGSFSFPSSNLSLVCYCLPAVFWWKSELWSLPTSAS